jgi:large subunit ribosomal protein L24
MGLYKSVDKRASTAHVKTDDEVIVVSGDDKGKRGKIIAVSPKEGKVIVDGVNMVSKHVKPRRQGQQGGIIKTAGAIYACKVLPYCSKCAKGVRVKHRKSEGGKNARICAKCGEDL